LFVRKVVGDPGITDIEADREGVAEVCQGDRHFRFPANGMGLGREVRSEINLFATLVKNLMKLGLRAEMFQCLLRAKTLVNTKIGKTAHVEHET
jgi:hypothetical protein